MFSSPSSKTGVWGRSVVFVTFEKNMGESVSFQRLVIHSNLVITHLVLKLKQT